MGGKRRRRAGRESVRGQHRWDRLRAAPQRQSPWTFTAGNSVWTTPAFTADGSSFWGSLDLNIYRLSPHGHPVWHTFTPGFVVSSPAIGSDGTVYIGSFDSKLYALDPATGTPKWTFPTSDHVYSSPALGHDNHGHTNAIYFASTNGSVYDLSPSGKLAGATTPATRSAPRPYWAAGRRGTARSSTSAHPTASSTRSTRPQGAVGGRSIRRRAIPPCAIATT